MSAVDLVRKLLEKGADPNRRLKKAILQRHHTAGDSTLADGATPFLRASKSGDIEMMRALVTGGADAKLTMPNGSNALMYAAGLGWRNGSPAAPSYDQGTDEEAVEALRFLLGLGFDINGANDAGDTAQKCDNSYPMQSSLQIAVLAAGIACVGRGDSLVGPAQFPPAGPDDAAVRGVAEEYQEQTGYRPYIFSGSSPGAAAFGCLRLAAG